MSQKPGRSFLLNSVAVALVLGFSGGAYAQEQATAVEEEEIVVTGSRIPQPDYQFSNPVTSMSGEQLQYSGVTNVADFLQDVPALGGSVFSNTAANSGDQGFIGSVGLNQLNLRNLGTQRTLVLVNGRRHVAAVPASADIDTNTIPTDLIERVDVLTGGASAIYGADGVSGVVNFIMRDDFEGLRTRGQYGEADAGGAENFFASATAGVNFAQGRGNVAASFEVSHEGALTSFERAHTRRGARVVRNPNDPSDDPNIPDRIALDNLRWFQSGPVGAVDANLDFDTEFDAATDGPWDMGTFPGGIQSFTFQQGGSGTPVAGYGLDLLGETDRFAANIFGHYDLTDNIRFFTEQKVVVTDAVSFGQPTFDIFLVVNGDNPFIPPNIAAAALGNDSASFGLPDNSVLVTRDNLDFGFRGEDISRNTYRGVWGVEGDISNWLSYNASYVYGRVETDNVALNNRYNDRFAAAVDVVDADPGPGVTPVCRSNLDPSALGPNVAFQGWAEPTSFTPGPGSGCVPYDVFHPSAAAIDWVRVNSRRDDENTQQVGTAYVVGSVPGLRLPGGEFGFVLGAEWRRETAQTTPALEDQLGLTFNNRIAPSRGSYEVREGFAEVSLPLAEGQPFFEELTLNGAVRFSDYSSFGDTTTWNYGVIWSPIQDITFRGTKAEAARVPNIGELFSPESQTFARIADPCDISRLNEGTSFREANCAALLTALGVDPTAYVDPSFGVTLAGRQSGNRNLIAEVAETTTFGAILRPRFIEGLTLSVDYYDINLTHAINTLNPEDIANQCVDLPSIDNEFCDVIFRENGTGGIVDFLTQPFNVASFATTGVDFSVRYLFDPERFGVERDIGTFALSLVGSHTDKLEFVNLPGAAPDPALEEQTGAPEWQVNFDLTWEYGPLTLNYGYSYFSETLRLDDVLRKAQPDAIDPSLAMVDGRHTHDIQARWNFGDRFTLYGGVNNLFNQEPDPYLESFPVSAVGRFFYVGFTTSIDSLTERH